MKYQIGERVRVKDDAWEIETDDLNFARPDMDKFCGGTYIIRSYDGMNYKLENVKSEDEDINDDGYWMWAVEWLEDPVDLQPINIEENELLNLFE